MDQQHNLSNVRRQLDELRRRSGIRQGDELDHALVAIEGLAVTIAAMSSDTAALIAKSERSVGAIVSATMTKHVLWRIAVLPAALAAAVAALICMVDHTLTATRAEQIIADDHAFMAQQNQANRQQVEAFRTNVQADLDRRERELDEEKARVEGVLPNLMIQKAEHVTGAARSLIEIEASVPGFLNWVATNGIATMRIAEANRDSLCPQTIYIDSNPDPFCAYRKPKT